MTRLIFNRLPFDALFHSLNSCIYPSSFLVNDLSNLACYIFNCSRSFFAFPQRVQELYIIKIVLIAPTIAMLTLILFNHIAELRYSKREFVLKI